MHVNCSISTAFIPPLNFKLLFSVFTQANSESVYHWLSFRVTRTNVPFFDPSPKIVIRSKVSFVIRNMKK